MTEPLDEALKELDDALAENDNDPDAGEDLPEYEPVPEDPDDVSVTFIKKGT